MGQREPTIREMINRLSRERVVSLLESACIACFDEESMDVLREALIVNVEDDTIPRWRVKAEFYDVA